MKNNIHYITVSEDLKKSLDIIMNEELFNPFLLVGGTALSLQMGHRISVDIDLFTDTEYGSIDFKKLEEFFVNRFKYCESLKIDAVGVGKSFFVGFDSTNLIKIDVYYNDPFVFEIYKVENIRMASIEEIIAMKIDVISRTGRKKDFWDIHECMENYSFQQMIDFHRLKYPFTHDEKLIKAKITDFSFAENDFEPICLRGKNWDIIKLDFIDFVR